jgi:hypothetical protein
MIDTTTVIEEDRMEEEMMQAADMETPRIMVVEAVEEGRRTRTKGRRLKETLGEEEDSLEEEEEVVEDLGEVGGQSWEGEVVEEGEEEEKENLFHQMKI